MRGLVAALFILPLAAIILPGGLGLHDPDWFAVVALMIAGPIAGSAIGLVLGTAVEARRINLAFAIVLTPLLFTGATFYPWSSLDHLRWFQIVTLLNPLTYVSEGLRGALTGAPHLGAGWVALGLFGSLLIFGGLGVRGFIRRAVD